MVRSVRLVIAQALGISAMISLLVYLVVAIGLETGVMKIGLASRQVVGIGLGLPWMILFPVSFGIGYGLKSRLITDLLIAGGVIYIAFLVIATVTQPQSLYYVNPNVFYQTLGVSCVFLGLGLFRLLKTIRTIKQSSAPRG
jgi:hypothetical protein